MAMKVGVWGSKWGNSVRDVQLHRLCRRLIDSNGQGADLSFSSKCPAFTSQAYLDPVHYSHTQEPYESEDLTSDAELRVRTAVARARLASKMQTHKAFSNSLEVGGVGYPFSSVAHLTSDRTRPPTAQSPFPSLEQRSRALCIVLHLVSFRSLFYISWIINTHFLLNARATPTTGLLLSTFVKDEWRAAGKEHTISNIIQFRIRIHSHLDLFFGLLVWKSVCMCRMSALWNSRSPSATGDAPLTLTHTHAARHIFELFRDNKWASGEKMPLVHSEHSRIIVRYSGFIAITEQVRLTISMLWIEFCVERISQVFWIDIKNCNWTLKAEKKKKNDWSQIFLRFSAHKKKNAWK